MQHLRDHDVDMLTVGQYLQPSKFHHPVVRYVTPEEFKEIETPWLRDGLRACCQWGAGTVVLSCG